jgi:hypothetical protein
MASQKGNGEMAQREMTGEVQRTSPVAQMIRAMAMDATMDTEAVFQGDDILGILSAENEEDMFEADMRGPLNFQDLGDCELCITNVQVKYGRPRTEDEDEIKTMFVDPETGRQMYLMVNMHRISDAGGKRDRVLPKVGEEFQANTSARFVVSKLWWLYTRGLIDASAGKSYEVRVDSTELGSGRAVIKLDRVPQRTVKA